MTTEIERRLTRHDEKQVLTEILAAIRDTGAGTSQALERLRGQALNTVLVNELIVIPTDGVVRRSFGRPIGSAVVFNYTAGDVYAASGEAGSTTPDRGIGVSYIPALTWLAFPVADAELTIYGTAGQKVSLQAFTGMLGLGQGRI